MIAAAGYCKYGGDGIQKYQFTSGVGKKGSAAELGSGGGWRGIAPAGNASGGGGRKASCGPLKGAAILATELGPAGRDGGGGGGVSFDRARRVGWEGKGAYMRLTVEFRVREPSPRLPGFAVRALLKMPSGTTRSRSMAMSSIVRSWPSVNFVK